MIEPVAATGRALRRTPGAYRCVADADVAHRRALLRADLNTPMAGNRVADATRIERFAPTVRDLADRGAAVVVMTHLGRPRGAVAAGLTVAPLAAALAAAIERPVGFVDDCVGAAAERATARLRPGAVTLLQNLRFHPGEERNDPVFARALAAHGEIYVNDAFSCAHRAHASTDAITRQRPAFAGPAMMRELSALTRALEAPQRPVAALVGGAKVSTKLAVLENLWRRVDCLIVGGGMANTFLRARGHGIGRSLFEPDLVETARRILTRAERAGCEIVLPTDVVVADAMAPDARYTYAHVASVPDDMMILDVGPRTIGALSMLIGGCRTLLWNGPLGAFEMAPFDRGTVALARAAAELTDSGRLVTVAGGGDTAAALNAAGVTDRFSFVSTAGGAFLEWLEGKDLPGIVALRTDN